MSRSENYSLLLLAGGKSSRMGKNKAELLYMGRSFVENSIAKAAPLGIEKIYLSGYKIERDDVQTVRDIYPERGPLGGIHACMNKKETPYCFILPVDVPQIPLEVLEDMLKFHERHCLNTEGKQYPVVLKHQTFMEPLIGIYPVTMVEFIEERILAQRLSVFRMIEAWGCECYHADIPKWQIANINTQEEYKKLLILEERDS